MKIDQVAVQLYTVREYLKNREDYDHSLKKIAEIGYRSVQISGPRPIPEKEIAELCRQHGLTINSSHEDATLLLENPQQAVENLKALGCKYTAYPFPRGLNLENPDAVDSRIRQLNEVGRILSESGQTLCYHNHNHEFRKVNGQIILERIYKISNPEYIQAELDTYWIQMGGGNPVQWCQAMSGRLPLLHLKDVRINRENKPEFAEVGEGNLNFKEIVAAAGDAGCKWFIVEQDICPGNPFDSLAKSFAYICKHLVSDKIKSQRE
jgi:sugar phosphate isomerase/epimerase